MLSQDQIQQALHASRVVPLSVPSANGPFGLQHLIEAVAGIPDAPIEKRDRVRRAVELSADTWDKLDRIAETAGKAATKPVSASQLAALVLEQYASQI
jgi:hypothetical protein